VVGIVFDLLLSSLCSIPKLKQVVLQRCGILAVKGTVSTKSMGVFGYERIDLCLNKSRAWFLKLSDVRQSNKHISYGVKAKGGWLNSVVAFM
jgi:hypothetical protein